MTDPLPEILAQCLDALEKGELTLADCLAQHPAHQAELAPLLAAALRLETAPRPRPAAAFRRNARIRLLNQMAAQVKSAPTQPPAPTRTQTLTLGLTRLLAALAVICVVLFAGGAISYTAANALPGDALYSAKLILEDLKLASASDAEDAILQTQFASNRLTEIQLLTVQGRYADIPAAVVRFEINVEGATLALTGVARNDSNATYTLIIQMQRSLSAQAEVLSNLLIVVPEQTRPAIERAILAAHIFSLGG